MDSELYNIEIENRSFYILHLFVCKNRPAKEWNDVNLGKSGLES